MGCGGSKDSSDDKAIDFEMETTKIDSYDKFFKNAQDVLEAAEELRSGIQDTVESMHELAENHKLEKEGVLSDSVCQWLWAVSANYDGNIKQAKIDISQEVPYVSGDLWNSCTRECYDFQEELKGFLKTVVEGPKTLLGLIENLNGLIEKANEMKDTVKDDATGAGLGMMDAAKAAANTAKNIAKMVKGSKKMTVLKDVLTQAGENIKELLPKAKEMLQKCDEVGAKAAKDGNKTPAQCLKYLPGPFKSEQQLKKEEKERQAKQKKNKDKKGKKKGKSDEKKEEKDEEKDQEKEEEQQAEIQVEKNEGEE